MFRPVNQTRVVCAPSSWNPLLSRVASTVTYPDKVYAWLTLNRVLEKVAGRGPMYLARTLRRTGMRGAWASSPSAPITAGYAVSGFMSDCELSSERTYETSANGV